MSVGDFLGRHVASHVMDAPMIPRSGWRDDGGYSAEAVAGALKKGYVVATDCVRRWIAEGRLKTTPGGNVRPDDLASFLRGQGWTAEEIEGVHRRLLEGSDGAS